MEKHTDLLTLLLKFPRWQSQAGEKSPEEIWRCVICKEQLRLSAFFPSSYCCTSAKRADVLTPVFEKGKKKNPQPKGNIIQWDPVAVRKYLRLQSIYAMLCPACSLLTLAWEGKQFSVPIVPMVDFPLLELVMSLFEIIITCRKSIQCPVSTITYV